MREMCAGNIIQQDEQLWHMGAKFLTIKISTMWAQVGHSETLRLTTLMAGRRIKNKIR